MNSLLSLFEPVRQPETSLDAPLSRRDAACDAILADVAHSTCTASVAFAERFEVVVLGAAATNSHDDDEEARARAVCLAAEGAKLLASHFSISRRMLMGLIWRRSAASFKLRALAIAERAPSCRVVTTLLAGFAVSVGGGTAAEIVYVATARAHRGCGFGRLLACCVAEAAREMDLGSDSMFVSAAADSVSYWERVTLVEGGAPFAAAPSGLLALFSAFSARFQGAVMMQTKLPSVPGAAVAHGARALKLRVLPASSECDAALQLEAVSASLCSLQLVGRRRRGTRAGARQWWRALVARMQTATASSVAEKQSEK
tara:strand:+ start:240 stop:1184 length:945 start_codon:yes stop_codon:yes gene_type:complete